MRSRRPATKDFSMTRLAKQSAFAIDEKNLRPAQEKPFGEGFIRRVAAVAIVVAGTDQ